MEELTFSAIGFLSMCVVGVGFSDLPKKKSFILPNRPLDDWEEGAGEDLQGTGDSEKTATGKRDSESGTGGIYQCGKIHSYEPDVG